MRRKPDPRCPRCGYSLRAASRPQCPECGADLTLTGVRMFGPAPWRSLVLAALVVLAVAWLGTVLAVEAVKPIIPNGRMRHVRIELWPQPAHGYSRILVEMPVYEVWHPRSRLWQAGSEVGDITITIERGSVANQDVQTLAKFSAPLGRDAPAAMIRGLLRTATGDPDGAATTDVGARRVAALVDGVRSVAGKIREERSIDVDQFVGDAFSQWFDWSQRAAFAGGVSFDPGVPVADRWHVLRTMLRYASLITAAIVGLVFAMVALRIKRRFAPVPWAACSGSLQVKPPSLRTSEAVAKH